MRTLQRRGIVIFGGTLSVSPGETLRKRQGGAERYPLNYFHRMNADPSQWVLVAGSVAVGAYLAYLLSAAMIW